MNKITLAIILAAASITSIPAHAAGETGPKWACKYSKIERCKRIANRRCRRVGFGNASCDPGSTGGIECQCYND